MPVCEACAKIETHKRHVSPHSQMKFVGYDRGKGYKPLGQASVEFKLYECQSCGTKWQYEDDKNDPHVGFTVRK